VNPSRRYLLISPCRDEARYLRRTLDSVAAQSVRPAPAYGPDRAVESKRRANSAVPSLDPSFTTTIFCLAKFGQSPIESDPWMPL
jgi:hypothetical protein